MNKKNTINGIIAVLMLWILAMSYSFAQDITPPELIADRPVKFNSETRILTLEFNELIDATPIEDVDLTKLIIRNHKFDLDGDGEITAVIVDEELNLESAIVTESDDTIVTIELTIEQRDVLKGDKPELVIDAGAVKDMAGNPVDTVPSVNVSVTPPLLSNVECEYKGMDVDTDTNMARLILTFSNALEREHTDPTKVIVANAETGGEYFSLSLAEFADELVQDALPDESVAFDLDKTHRDEIASWQKDQNLYVRLEENAVQGKEMNYSAAVDTGERIKWIYDTAGPDLVSGSYSHLTKELKLDFDEAIRVEYDNGTTPDGTKVKIMSADGANEVTLTNDERKPDQFSGTTSFYFVLTDEHRDTVSSWKADEADPFGLIAYIAPGAFQDISRERGTDSYSSNIVEDSVDITWTKDTDAPTLENIGNTYVHVNPHDSIPLKGVLTLTFTESVDVSTLNLAKVELKAQTESLSLEEGAEVKTTADGTTIELEITDATKVYTISGWGSEYSILHVELEAEAITDMAGNYNAAISNKVLNTWTKDTTKPLLQASASSYAHDDDSGNHYAKLVLKFDEQMDTRVDYIDATGIELANEVTDGDTITLAQDEIKPDQDFSDEIVFYLTDAHKDTISKWGSPLDKNKTTLYIRLIENAVRDRAGNGIAAMMTHQALGTWTKDTKPAEYDSSHYNANTKELKIRFKEWMDAMPTSLVNPSKVTITDKDGTAPADIPDLTGASINETDKTNTITMMLTPAQDMAVKSLVEPLKLNMAAGAAKDIAGNDNAVVLGEEIFYTADTTSPDFDYKDGKVASSYVHKDKRLTLNFDEAINKNPYTDIDAMKITLLSAASDGEGFSLAQAEIERAQPGDIVQPSDVDKISFILSNEHWNTVARWSDIYIQIAAGAVKDTTTANVIGTIDPIQIHPDYVQIDTVPSDDTTPPDVRLPESYVKEAAVETDVTITATVTDDISVEWVRLYYQVGGALKTFIVMENTTDNAYEGTIPGTAVSNKGLCYYILAEDHLGNRNIVNGQIKTRKGDKNEWWHTNIPGGFNVTVTGTSVTLPANTLPVFDVAVVPSKYRMISAPIDASTISTDLFAPFGTAGDDWKVWRYTESAEYNGYQPGHINPFTFTPGVAAWIGTVNPDNNLIVAGSTIKIAADNNDYKAKIKLHQGWNQIGCPFNFSRNWDSRTIGLDGGDIMDSIYWFTGEDETLSYSFASLDVDVPNQTVFAANWKTAADFKGPATGSGWPGTLDPWGGYLVYAYKEGATLTIDATAPGKSVFPTTPAPSSKMPYNWSVKVMPEAGGVSGTAKFAGIVSDATDGMDKYDVIDLPALPGQTVRLSFVTESGDYLQDMRAPSNEMFWHFKVSSAVNTPVTIRFDATAVPLEYRTILLIDIVTDAVTNLRKVASYIYKPSEKIRNFKLIISKAHPETYIIPKRSALLQNYPNPFNPETWVPYRLAKSGDVTINIYNVAGQLVRTLKLGHREAGSYIAKERAAYWDGKNIISERVASGVYLYHIQSGLFHATKRMVIVK